MKTKVPLIIIGVLFLLGLIGTIIYLGLFQQSVLFEFGFEPYGESVNQITDLQKDRFRISTLTECPPFNIWCDVRTYGAKVVEWDATEKTLAQIEQETISLYGTHVGRGVQYHLYAEDTISPSKYWDITRHSYCQTFLSGQTCATSDFSGNDFNLKAFYTGGSSNIYGPANANVIFETTEDFSERDFKTNIVSYGSRLNIYLNGDTETLLYSHDFPNVNSDANFVINPSVISDKINFYWNGQKIKSITKSGEYTIKIEVNLNPGYYLTLKNPSYKQQFGCTKEPGEQYYVTIFNEGDRVNINKLEKFKKFCLAESPLKIYSNIGSTTDIEVLGGLVNNEEYIVPSGQIWSIEYIGDLSIFKTECEAGKVYNTNDDVCMARTVLTFQCPEGSEFDFEKGYCTIETKPIIYEFSSIKTHQNLETGGHFRFTHIKQDEEVITPNSIIIGEDTFDSKGVNYIGQESSVVTYPKDLSNWEISFSFDGKDYTGKLNDEFTLNDFLKVKITDMHGFRDDDTMTVEDFKAEYTFDFFPDFLLISYENNIITIANNYQSFDGGIVLTKTNNIGTTTIETIEKELKKGNTEFLIDTTNILEIKIRPFVIVQTPVYEYRFDSKDAMTKDIGLIREVEFLELSIKEKAEEIRLLATTLDEQIIILDALELTTIEKAKLIKELTTNIEEQAKIISGMELTVQEQKIIIEELTSDINEQANLINELTINLQQKAELVSHLQVTNEEQAELIRLMELSFADQADIINALNKEVEDDAIIISNLGLSLEEQGELISQLKLTNQEQAELVNALNLKVGEQAELISNLKLTIEGEQELVSKLNLTIKQQQDLIDELEKEKEVNYLFWIIGGFIALIVLIFLIILVSKKKN